MQWPVEDPPVEKSAHADEAMSVKKGVTWHSHAILSASRAANLSVENLWMLCEGRDQKLFSFLLLIAAHLGRIPPRVPEQAVTGPSVAKTSHLPGAVQ